ncbi:cytochrome P450 CYP72A616 [Cryptomeria japonica]|uniref:cytochrome P450 CYP72A616 n=1 Tax=Cryptomeria japonica TaxID=3369 RepID=UPI0025AD7D1A|nr:cytochrome P450 CYP72A616 [Cryptomeria japonica]
MEWVFWFVALVLAGLGLLLLKVARDIWWTPLQIKKYFEAQGIGGPPYKLLYGNAPDIVKMAAEESSKPSLSGHNITPRVIPAFHQWGKIYGRDYVYWFGTKPRVFLAHPELVKEVLSNKFGHYEKVKLVKSGARGLVELEGEKWAHHRRILNPAFHMEALKGMIPSIVESGSNMCREWRNLISSGANEIDVFKEFSVLTSDIISRTAFGSSYAEGNHIFRLLTQLLLLVFERFRRVYIPGSRFLPIKENRLGWWLDKEIKRCIRQVIKGRERNAGIENSSDYGTDLLGLMMNSNKKQSEGKLQNNMGMTIDDIIAECKTFYIAGQETTTILLTWTMVLLGMHQDWQDRARREVLEVCGKNEFPNADAVNGLKIVGMIFNESLRLYPPIVDLSRQPLKPMKLGELSIAAGTQLQIPILAMHHDPLLWGNDVHEFNPERFRQGISKAAKHPMAFMPFSLGPRICIGQNFALLEAKVVLAMILQRFSFVISPHYIHAPVHSFTLKPKYGAQVILHIN